MKKIVNAISMLFNTIYSHAIWFVRDLKYGMFCRNKVDLENRLLVGGHIIEKGITMPNRRYGFGLGVVRMMLSLCNKYIDRYGTDSEQLLYAVDDLREYLDIHQTAKYELPADIVKNIVEIQKLGGQDFKPVNCLDVKKSDFFKETSDFKDFAYSRHTSRWFNGEPVENDLITKAIDLARTAPSACNRQSIKVYVVAGEKKEQVIGLQNGNRGFGDNIGQMLIITSNQIDWDEEFRTSAYLDGGIFTMNLLYALHYFKICACTLNAHLNIRKQAKLRKIVGMDKAEIPVCFIAIGKPKERMRIAKSRRLSLSNILKFVE